MVFKIMAHKNKNAGYILLLCVMILAWESKDSSPLPLKRLQPHQLLIVLSHWRLMGCLGCSWLMWCWHLQNQCKLCRST